MKRMNIIKFLRVGGIALATGYFSMFSGLAQAGNITGSVHDFSTATYSDGVTNINWNPDGELCTVCHTPHASDTSVALAPLWDHELTNPAFTYTTYSSGTLDANGGALAQPVGVSQLCLSCHDGSVAIDSFGGAAGTNFITAGFLPSLNSRLIGGDTDSGGNPNSLKNDHPVGFTFDAALIALDPGLHDPATASADIGTGSAFPKTGTIAENLLSGGTSVQCTSCHDVHNNYVDESSGLGNYKLLKISFEGSALCLTCHNK